MRNLFKKNIKSKYLVGIQQNKMIWNFEKGTKWQNEIPKRYKNQQPLKSIEFWCLKMTHKQKQ